jgi:hypothetical protein
MVFKLYPSLQVRCRSDILHFIPQPITYYQEMSPADERFYMLKSDPDILAPT